MSLLCGGEGFHNYHHTFPYDYSTSEWGAFCNVTTLFLDAMWAVGLAHSMKVATPSTVVARARRTGQPELTRAARTQA